MDGATYSRHPSDELERVPKDGNEDEGSEDLAEQCAAGKDRGKYESSMSRTHATKNILLEPATSATVPLATRALLVIRRETRVKLNGTRGLYVRHRLGIGLAPRVQRVARVRVGVEDELARLFLLLFFGREADRHDDDLCDRKECWCWRRSTDAGVRKRETSS